MALNRKTILASLAPQLSAADLKKASKLEDQQLAELYDALFPTKVAKVSSVPEVTYEPTEDAQPTPAQVIREKATKARSKAKKVAVPAPDSPERVAATAMPAPVAAATKAKKKPTPSAGERLAERAEKEETAAQEKKAKTGVIPVTKVKAKPAKELTSLEKARLALKAKREAEMVPARVVTAKEAKAAKPAKAPKPAKKASDKPHWNDSLLKARQVLAAQNAAKVAARMKAAKEAKAAEKAEAKAEKAAKTEAPTAALATRGGKATKSDVHAVLMEMAQRLGVKIDIKTVG
jgi:hypothetical protein